MAIKVNGTTVIDDSRNLENIASVDATTVAALSAAGVGDITAVTAGSGLTGGGTSGAVTVNHADTSSQGSVNNSGNTVIQDITLDTYGHVTNINSTTISASASTAYGAVGTYMWVKRSQTNIEMLYNTTISGSVLRPNGILTPINGVGSCLRNVRNQPTLSGTWRVMGDADNTDSNWYTTTVAVRIS